MPDSHLHVVLHFSIILGTPPISSPILLAPSFLNLSSCFHVACEQLATLNKQLERHSFSEEALLSQSLRTDF